MTTDDSGKETEGIFQCPECDSYNDAAHYSRRKGGVMCQVCGTLSLLSLSEFQHFAHGPPKRHDQQMGQLIEIPSAVLVAAVDEDQNPSSRPVSAASSGRAQTTSSSIQTSAATEGAFRCRDCKAFNDRAHFSRRKEGVMCEVCGTFAHMGLAEFMSFSAQLMHTSAQPKATTSAPERRTTENDEENHPPQSWTRKSDCDAKETPAGATATQSAPHPVITRRAPPRQLLATYATGPSEAKEYPQMLASATGTKTVSSQARSVELRSHEGNAPDDAGAPDVDASRRTRAVRKACPMGTKALPESAVTQASRASVHREGAQEVLKEHKDKAALCVNPALLAAQEAAPGSPRFTRAVCVSIAVCVLAVVAAAAMQPGGKTNTYTPAPPRQGATSGFWGMGRKAKAAAPATQAPPDRTKAHKRVQKQAAETGKMIAKRREEPHPLAEGSALAQGQAAADGKREGKLHHKQASPEVPPKKRGFGVGRFLRKVLFLSSPDVK